MFTLFIGTEFNRSFNRIPAPAVALAIRRIKTEAARLFGGYSVSMVSGGWISPSNELIEEASLRLELDIRSGGCPDGAYMTSQARAFAFAQWSAGQLDQASVLLSGPQGAELVKNPFPSSVELESARQSDRAS